MAAAKNADLVILALGEAGNMTGEASSRAHLELPGNQEQLMEQVVAAGKPVVLVLFDGRPTAIPWAATHVRTILGMVPRHRGGPGIGLCIDGRGEPSVSHRWSSLTAWVRSLCIWRNCLQDRQRATPT